tara:strand:+ start:222 stop:1226 length:1005 start_codon:yes stop_codon:yes gene_type:complete
LEKPSVPQDEKSRLETLKSLNILDTLPEERFDRLTRMAKRLFDVPIALVSLVDDNRQWFKSCVGLSVNETSRDISFCGHAILGDEVFIIPNALGDPRFADNPLVLDEPHIRFYAGCPLNINGHKLGTLCIIDIEPRDFEKEDIESFEDLASMVERELVALQMAILDELTKIPNRRGFMMLAENSLSLCNRQNIPAALAFIDLDNFKPINDKFGHAEGDRALIAFVNTIRKFIRDSDLFARLGGDEFVLFFIDATIKQAEAKIDEISRLLISYNKEANRGYEIAFSYGIVEFNPESNSTLTKMLADGDSLMYKVKEKKRKNELTTKGHSTKYFVH